MNRPVVEIGEIHATSTTGARYYEIRLRIKPYSEPTVMVVEAQTWEEVLKKYPHAECLAVLGDRHRPVRRQPVWPTIQAEQPERVEIASRPFNGGRQQSANRQSTGARCRMCDRIRLTRAQYAWRRANGLAVWRCQHRRPAPKPARDLVEAVALIVVLAVCAIAVRLQ